MTFMCACFSDWGNILVTWISWTTRAALQQGFFMFGPCFRKHHTSFASLTDNPADSEYILITSTSSTDYMTGKIFIPQYSNKYLISSIIPSMRYDHIVAFFGYGVVIYIMCFNNPLVHLSNFSNSCSWNKNTIEHMWRAPERALLVWENRHAPGCKRTYIVIHY